MTAINVLKRANDVSIITDCAVMDDEGQLRGAGTKVIALPHLNAAVAVCGTPFALAILAEALAGAQSYEELKASAVELLRDGVEIVRRFSSFTRYGNDIRLFVAGHDGAKPDAFVISTRAEPGVEPWKALAIPDLCSAPGSPAIQNAVLDLVGARGVDDLDPVEDGGRILDVQRWIPTALFDGKAMFAVGVAGVVTTITAEGISQRVVRRWDDYTGVRISPRQIRSFGPVHEAD